ncbi:MAG: xylosidase [Ruminococcaceae bacterium]|nr:xylosidase [Oscillospiraceae bacterium]
MNPLLPELCFMPDAEAHVMPNGRLYLYGSWDLSGNPGYCSGVMHTYSTDDMVHFTDHGVIFENTEEHRGMPWSQSTVLYAPDAIHKNGKYYLYVCSSCGEEGVAVADHPAGPFSCAEPVIGADGRGIDPAVFVDEDGQAYYLWGQFSLHGGKLADDMKTIIPDSEKADILTEWEHGFHEGSSLRRRGDKYYIVYTDISRGRATCLSYAVSDHPLGPYKKGGVIIDNVGCDPKSWNNHGSIECFGGQWYVFYHRSSQNGQTCRRVCAEPIFFDENGMIAEVRQTSSGAEWALSPALIPARIACRMMGGCYITERDGREVLLVSGGGHWGQRDWAEYRYIDFGDGTLSQASFCVRGSGSIAVRCDSGELCRVSFACEDCETVTVPMASASGRQTVWLFFEGEFVLREFGFQ